MILALRDTEGEYEAIALIQACLSENPNDEKFCHLLWEISLKSSQENLIEEGLTHMRHKAEGRDNLAKHALRRLILHPSVPPNEKKRIFPKNMGTSKLLSKRCGSVYTWFNRLKKTKGFFTYGIPEPTI